jgi:hypothetical protein
MEESDAPDVTPSKEQTSRRIESTRLEAQDKTVEKEVKKV